MKTETASPTLHFGQDLSSTTELMVSESQSAVGFDEPIDIEDPLYKLDYDDDVESSDDEDAGLKCVKQVKASGYLHKDNSYLNFLRRSERNSVRGQDPSPSKEETLKRSVQFQDVNLEVVHEIPQVTDEEKKLYWLQLSDFDRFASERKVTIFRWENHMDGRIRFDENENTLRGIEVLINRNQEKMIMMQKRKHLQNVMKEINRQKEEGADSKSLDWEKLRQASQRLSEAGATRARNIGEKDEQERIRAWEERMEPSDEKKKQDIKHDEKSSKQKKFLFFWQKKTKR